MKNLWPPMEVEKRKVNNMHGVSKANRDPQFLAQQIQDAIQLNNDAKVYEFRELLYAEVDQKIKPLAWKKTTLDILVVHISKVYPDVTGDEIMKSVNDVFGFSGFDQVARWVQNDMCSEVFNKMLAYCLREGQDHKRERGFIDGSGFGYLQEYVKWGTHFIEKAFDIKYTEKMPRPLRLCLDMYGIDLTRFANKINPGHWSYIQGHITKALAAVFTLQKVFNLDNKCDRSLVIAGLCFGFGRDGNFIHLPQDTMSGLELVKVI